jgi:H/ACA ribonucleoprotein complex subunit 4
LGEENIGREEDRARRDPRAGQRRGDPKVTGILPIALEEATKVLKAFLLSGKEYVCLMILHGDSSEDEVRRLFEEFTGPIFQKPPLRASVKRAVRVREIYACELLEMADRKVLFRIACQSGTYIRKFCSDLGQVLGFGAHMAELRRIRSGPFVEDKNLYTLHDLLRAKREYERCGDESPLREVVRPLEEALEYMPKVYIRDSAVDAICHGANLAIPGITKLDKHIERGDTVAIMTLKGEAVALGEALMTTEEIMELEKGIAVKTDRVVMRRGLYPPWKGK